MSQGGIQLGRCCIILGEPERVADCGKDLCVVDYIIMLSPPPPAPSGGPQMVRAMAINSTHITITWEAVNCAERNSNISGYVVRYTPPSSGGIDSVTVVGTGDAGGRVTIGGLNPSTQYSIRVAAVNSEGALGVFSAISVTSE